FGGLVSCRPAPTGSTDSTDTTSPPIEAQNPDAVITDIPATPVWVQPNEASSESIAAKGQNLIYGNVIITADEGLAEVNLKSGLAFRIGGNARLILQPDNQLNLESGQMITWVTPGQQVPTKIITPAGVAGLRGTTLFVDLPEDPADEVEFFSWEGTIAVRPLGASEDVIITSGEQLRIRPGENDVAELRQRVRRLTQEEIVQRRSRSRLLNGFSQPLPTQSQIDAALESEE
ncbi:MAG TPA: FecR domain-containing protein, partial [Trichocoleus sp.]